MVNDDTAVDTVGAIHELPLRGLVGHLKNEWDVYKMKKVFLELKQRFSSLLSEPVIFLYSQIVQGDGKFLSRF